MKILAVEGRYVEWCFSDKEKHHKSRLQKDKFDRQFFHHNGIDFFIRLVESNFVPYVKVDSSLVPLVEGYFDVPYIRSKRDLATQGYGIFL